MDYKTSPMHRKTARTPPKAAAPTSPAVPLLTVHYRVAFEHPDSHLLAVRCTIEAPAASGETLLMPAWIPGSYLIRDFARHVVALSARADGQAVPVAKDGLHAWHVATPPGSRRLVIDYAVYAWDASVRGAHFDRSHAFLNGAAVFLRVAGREDCRCEVEFAEPRLPALRGMRVATTLPPADGTAEDGFGLRAAADYYTLIDHPVEIGRFASIEFATGRGRARCRHRVAVSGRHAGDLDRLRRDLARICAWQIDFWGGRPPFAEYLFLLQLSADGYGGLEHADSTALLARRDDLPAAALGEPDEGYRRLLGLFSHEYFHAWLVKRIRPAGHRPPDLQAPAPTDLLWLFEGFTAYYDDLVLVRSGVIAPATYLELLGKTISRVLAVPGRFRQSLAEAGRDAWIKLYKPDENSDNATVSYYAKGSLLALALDLRLRRESGGQRSLDDFMRRLWRDFGAAGEPLDEAAVLAALADFAGKPAERFVARAIHGTADLPLRPLLQAFGVHWQQAPGEAGAALGLTLAGGGETLPRVAKVASGSAAEAAGLAGGDLLVAFDGLRADKAVLDNHGKRLAPGSAVAVHVFRDGVLHTLTLLVPKREPSFRTLALAPHAGSRAAALRRAWLGA